MKFTREFIPYYVLRLWRSILWGAKYLDCFIPISRKENYSGLPKSYQNGYMSEIWFLKLGVYTNLWRGFVRFLFSTLDMIKCNSVSNWENTYGNKFGEKNKDKNRVCKIITLPQTVPQLGAPMGYPMFSINPFKCLHFLNNEQRAKLIRKCLHFLNNERQCYIIALARLLVTCETNFRQAKFFKKHVCTCPKWQTVFMISEAYIKHRNTNLSQMCLNI